MYGKQTASLAQFAVQQCKRNVYIPIKVDKINDFLPKQRADITH